MLLNVQCLNLGKIGEIYVGICDFRELNVLCFVETWATYDSVDSFQIDGFTLGSYFCRSNLRGGGISIYLRDCLSFEKINLDKFCKEKHRGLRIVIQVKG